MKKTSYLPSSVQEVESITDIQLLYDIALGEKDSAIQNAAIEKLNGMEVLNVYDTSYKRTGMAPRSIVHRDGLWHETFHCWFMQVERAEGRETAYLWFQQRSGAKKDYPNLLDITSAGHLKYNEKPSDGVREIEEELGITVPFVELRDLGVRINVEKTPTLFNNEFNRVFLYDCPYGMDQVRFVDGEVQGIYRIKAEEGIRLFRGDTGEIAAEGYGCVEGLQVDKSLLVDISCFVPRPVDAYYLKMCIIADLAVKGYPYAAI